MILRDGVMLALRAITAHRLRSFLTLLGIAVGIAAVILLTSIGEGIHRFVLAEFSQFGTNVIGITPGRREARGGPPGLPASARPLTFEDAHALAQLPNVVGVVPTATGNAEVAGNGRLRRTSIFGGNAATLHVFNMRLRVGQFLPEEEGSEARSFVVLGPTLKAELFGAANALGARVRIGGQQFRVVGVLGYLIGQAGTAMIRYLYPTYPAFAPDWAVLAGLGTSILTGLVFGVLPARRAARMDPVQALAKR
jgi:putative ABC transport system permease protein